MKTAEIISDLRKKITCERIKPGEKLPKRQVLLDYYGISLGAFQKCINCLIDEGFLESRGTSGTLVRKYPPHHYCFGLVIPTVENSLGIEWDSFWHALLSVCKNFIDKDQRYSFKIYYSGKENSSDLSGWHKFIEDAEKRCIAGAIILHELHPSLRKKLCSIPLVHLNSHALGEQNEFLMEFDYNKLFDAALDHLVGEGCSKIAVLTNAAINPDFLGYMTARIASENILCPQEWIHGVGLTPETMPWLSKIVKLLFKKGQETIPDAILVLNENLLPYTLKPLAELGIIPGQNIKIVSHCNLPMENPLIRGIKYIGFDAKTVIQDSLDIFRKYRNGDSDNLQQVCWVGPVEI